MSVSSEEQQGRLPWATLSEPRQLWEVSAGGAHAHGMAEVPHLHSGIGRSSVALSYSGRFVAFASNLAGLVAGDAPGCSNLTEEPSSWSGLTHVDADLPAVAPPADAPCFPLPRRLRSRPRGRHDDQRL